MSSRQRQSGTVKLHFCNLMICDSENSLKDHMFRKKSKFIQCSVRVYINMLDTKIVKNDPKIIILLQLSKLVKHAWKITSWPFIPTWTKNDNSYKKLKIMPTTTIPTFMPTPTIPTTCVNCSHFEKQSWELNLMLGTLIFN